MHPFVATDTVEHSLSPHLHPNSGIPEFGILRWPKSDKSVFG